MASILSTGFRSNTGRTRAWEFLVQDAETGHATGRILLAASEGGAFPVLDLHTGQETITSELPATLLAVVVDADGDVRFQGYVQPDGANNDAGALAIARQLALQWFNHVERA